MIASPSRNGIRHFRGGSSPTCRQLGRMRRVIEVGILTPAQPQPHKCVHWVPIHASIINLRTKFYNSDRQIEWPGHESTSVKRTTATIVMQSSNSYLRKRQSRSIGPPKPSIDAKRLWEKGPTNQQGLVLRKYRKSRMYL